MNTLAMSVLKIAPPYDDELIRKVEQGFSDKLGFDVRFKVEEDASLLCGFTAYINGVVYDTSGKTRLASMNEYLLNSVLIPLAATNGDDLS